MSGLLVVGAGGHGKVVADIARDCEHWSEIAFLDDKFPESTSVSDWPVIGRLKDAHKFKERFPDAIVAIGFNKLRLEVLKKLLEEGFHSPVLVHPDASVSKSCNLGAGTVVCAQAAIKIDTDIGLGVIVNAGATIGHDCVLEDGVHVSPGGRISGGVTVGECSWLGSGAIVKELVSVGNGVVVGAGTVVIHDVPDLVTVVGVPGHIIKRNDGDESHQGGEYQRPTSAVSFVEPLQRLSTAICAPRFTGFILPDDPRWMETLARTSHDFFHLPGYLSASAPHEGGEPLLFLLDMGEHGLLVPLIRRSLGEFGEAFSKHYDVSSPYGYPGPLCWGDGWEALLPEMHTLFCEFLQQENIVSVFVRLNPFVGPAEELLAKLGGVTIQGPTVYIDLRDPERSWTGINSANRRSINHLLQQGYEVRFDEWENIDQVIDAYFDTMQRLKASPFYFFPRSYFQHLRDNSEHHFHLATVYTPSGELAGGCFFSEVGGLVQYFLMGTFETFMEASPSKLLINALRLWGIERGHHTLNLGGGVGARRDGLFEFKMRLSKSVANFSTFRRVLLPEVYEALSRSQGWEGQDNDYFPIYRKPHRDSDENSQSSVHHGCISLDTQSGTIP